MCRVPRILTFSAAVSSAQFAAEIRVQIAGMWLILALCNNFERHLQVSECALRQIRPVIQIGVEVL